MAEPSEGTPFLSDNDHQDTHDEPEDDYVKPLPANSHFKQPLRILAAVISLLSLGVGIVLIAAIIFAKTGPFEHVYHTTEEARDLAICAFMNFVLSTPTIFFQAPILINMAVHIAMSIVMLVFSEQVFRRGWPDEYWCRRWEPQKPPYIKPPKLLNPTWECIKARRDLRVMIGVSAGVGYLIGLLILTLLTLRVAALFRTKFWEGRRRPSFPVIPGWNPTGFTLQFTLKVIPYERPTPAPATDPAATVSKGKAADPGPSSHAESRLIETE
ncbi:hypothetical protein N431DRAFT_390431 [Stipitochalara longipes BDJ]|nr:hypothetical protein N431DRAFT_390431 [Stipitochalara longipes BDJ]